MSQTYNIIIDLGFSAPVHVREVVDGLNITEKRFLFHLMSNFKPPSSKYYETQTAMKSATKNADVSLDQEFQKHLTNASHKDGVIYQGK